MAAGDGAFVQGWVFGLRPGLGWLKFFGCSFVIPIMLGQIVTCYAVHRSFDRIQIFPLRMTVRVHVCTSARAKPANCARARILIMKFLPPSCDSASFELRLRVLRLAVIAYHTPRHAMGNCVAQFHQSSPPYMWDWDWRLMLWLLCEKQLTKNWHWMSAVFYTITTTPIFNLNLTCKEGLTMTKFRGGTIPQKQ